ncbi:hypothetical protein LCGC14_0585300 [marine sediment metagenome]|uniref:Uncharacterized protein n=1 Tax=marine sediment metagenome TaxID=412755 RepID=A0A0F9UNG8_9ZZZZ
MRDLTRDEAISVLTSGVEELQALASKIERALWGLRSSKSEIQRLTSQISTSVQQIRLESIRISERVFDVVKVD